MTVKLDSINQILVKLLNYYQTFNNKSETFAKITIMIQKWWKNKKTIGYFVYITKSMMLKHQRLFQSFSQDKTYEKSIFII